jgi:hypothetical protein
MIISRIYLHRRPLIFGLVLFLLCMLIDVPVFARTEDEGEPHVTNVNWTIDGEDIIITYDLVAPINTTYDIGLTMLREGSPTFSVVPRSVEGDVGQGDFSGAGKTIRWHFRSDVPEGLYGEGYYFQITVKPVGGGLPWYTVALGVAVLGGVVALLAGKKGEDATKSSELPNPPVRPIQP